MNKFDTKDIGGKVEQTGNGISGYNVDSELAPSWVSYHYGKLMIGGIVLVILAFIIYMIIDNA